MMNNTWLWRTLLAVSLLTVTACGAEEDGEGSVEENNDTGNNDVNNDDNNDVNNDENNDVNNDENNDVNNDVECTSDDDCGPGLICQESVCITEPGNNDPNNDDACQELEDAYQAAVEAASACNSDEDCQILNGQCGVGLGGCYESVNQDLSQEELVALGARFSQQECTNGVCDCAEAPPAICDQGTCGFGEGCPGRDIGETWQEDCNTCTCTARGAVCTEEACLDSCEEIEDNYAEVINANRACEANEDCQLLNGHCGVGIGGCYAAVNQDLSQEELNDAASAWRDAECIGPVCDCAPPPAVICGQEGQCEFGPDCGGRQLGEEWQVECNTCQCTDRGVLCTQLDCGDPCEGLELPECPRECGRGDMPGMPCERGDTCGNEIGDGCICDEEGRWSCFVHPPLEPGVCNQVCERSEPNSCETIEANYEQALSEARACEQDRECQTLFGQCGVGLGGCHEAVNQSLSQEELSAYGQEFQQAGCIGPVCRCTQPPPSRCVEGTCQLATSPCPGRQLGEQWQEDCNTCTCTEEGVACTERECPDSCEEIESNYARTVEAARFCETARDCQVLNGQCGVGLGGCYEFVNQSLSQDDLNALGRQFQETECVGPICRCTPPPEVTCLDQRCEPIAE